MRTTDPAAQVAIIAINRLYTHDGETEHLRRALSFFTEAIAADSNAPEVVGRIWKDQMMKPIGWSNRPAVHAVLQELTNLYLARVEDVHKEVTAHLSEVTR